MSTQIEDALSALVGCEASDLFEVVVMYRHEGHLATRGWRFNEPETARDLRIVTPEDLRIVRGEE